MSAGPVAAFEGVTGGGEVVPAAENEESPFSHITHPRKRAFLTLYARMGHKTKAAAAAGISRDALYSRPWREDAEFQEAVAQARLMAADVLEEEAHRRAVLGVEKPTGWHRGKPGGFVTEYSDTLLIFLLKAVKPEYRDRLEVTGKVSAADLTQMLDRLPDDQLARVLAGVDPRLVLAEWAETQLRAVLPPGRDVSCRPGES